ncbi:MAG: serpin family protein [Actinomycetota bacterium]
MLSLNEELQAGFPREGNLPWSPYSVASALGVAAAGARGRTYDELVRAISPGADLDGLADVLRRSARLTDADLAVTNTLWMRSGLEFRESYEQAVLGWPGGALRTVDFRGDPEGSLAKINDAVEQDTRGLIKDLLPPGSVHTETGAVIVNALYLKVAWQMPFLRSATRPAPFHAPSGTRDVPTMHQEERLGYATADGWRMATLPTEGEAVMDVLLPDDPDAALSVGTVVALQERASRTRMDLALPRFRVEATARLNEPLRGLGVADAFDADRADFSGIAAVPMFIETAVHKAVVDVDEHGFEGAAATALSMRMVSLERSRPVPFHVDRPFVVIVRHRNTGGVYFLARVADPR